MGLLESIFNYLIKKNTHLLKQIEQTEGTEKIIKLLNVSEEDLEDGAAGGGEGVQAIDATPDELLLLANCDLDEIIEKNRLIPRLTFYMDVSKIILDTIKSNCKLMALYNQVATSMLQFCLKYKVKQSYKKISDTLHVHFMQLEKAKKNPEMNAKIPFPVKLDSVECQHYLLELRHTQLEFALKMEQWSDAYKTSDIIFKLINKQEKRQVKPKL